jgi:TonB family protein
MAFTNREGSPQAFALLSAGKPHWWAFAASAVIQCTGLGLLLVIPLLTPQRLASRSQYLFTPLMTDWKPEVPKVSISRARAPLRVVEGKTPVLRAPMFEPKPVRIRGAPEIRPEFHVPTFDPPEPPQPRPGIRTGVLPSNVLQVTPAHAPSKVQTGGFDDPYGVPAAGDARRAMTINPVGSFDMPVGPGQGNGKGGSRGIRRVIANVGFGSGIGSPGEGGPGGQRHGAIEQGMFTDARPGKQTVQIQAKPEKPKIEPVEILYEPDPAYTPEARALHIEGEVVLEVVFAGSGEVKVVRIVQGLGHGLNEAAVAAARQIRFKPQRMNGKPVDSRALLRIVFQLAY